MTLGRYDGSTNAAGVPEALRTEVTLARQVRYGGRQPNFRKAYVFVWKRLREAAEPTNTSQRNTCYSHATAFAQPHSSPRPILTTCRLPVGTRANTDTATSSLRQRAGQPDTTREPTKSWAFHPPIGHPTLYFITSALGTGSARPRPPSGARCSHSSAAQRTSRPRRHHRESTIWLKSPPPTPYTCNTATQVTPGLPQWRRDGQSPMTLLHQPGSL